MKRRVNAWLVTVGLIVALTLIWGSAMGTIRISLPLAVLIGLGPNVALLLWAHRAKMTAILSAPRL